MNPQAELALAARLTLMIFGPMGILFFLIGLFLRVSCQRKQQNCTQMTTGEVVGYRYPNGAPAPVVEYQVEGQTYRAVRHYRGVITLTTRNPLREWQGEGSTQFYVDEKEIAHIRQRGGFANLQAVGEQVYPMGSTLDIYYNPEKPKEAFVERIPQKGSLTGLVFLWTGVGLAALGVLLYLLFTEILV